MSFPVGHERNEIIIRSLRAAKQPVHSLDKNLDQVNVLPLVETTYVIRLGNLSLMENQFDRPGVILDIEPVTDILPFSIDRKRTTLPDVVDEQRNQFFRELVRTVIVRAVRHDRRHPVGVMIGPDKMIA